MSPTATGYGHAIPSIDPRDIIPLARMVWATGRALFLVGQGGGGKTSVVVNTLGPAFGMRVFVVNYSGSAPPEVIGYGIPRPDGSMDYSIPTIIPAGSVIGDEHVILLVDEFSDYDPAVKSLLRGLFPATGQPMIGPHKLGPNVHVVKTGNRKLDGSRSSAVEDAPITERSVKIVWEPTVSGWLAYHAQRYQHGAADCAAGYTGPTDIPGRDELFAAAADSPVPTFLEYNAGGADRDGDNEAASLFCPPVVQPYDGVPHPCPRTWDAVCLAEHFRKSDPGLFELFCRGSVGNAATDAFTGFLAVFEQLPQIAKAKADPAGYPINTDDVQAQYALGHAALVEIRKDIRRDAAGARADLVAGKADWFVTVAKRMHPDIGRFLVQNAQRRGIEITLAAGANEILAI